MQSEIQIEITKLRLSLTTQQKQIDLLNKALWAILAHNGGQIDIPARLMIESAQSKRFVHTRLEGGTFTIEFERPDQVPDKYKSKINSD